MFIERGFPGQRSQVLAPPLIAPALERFPTSNVLVTHAGYFPHAAQHGRVRPCGAPETILIFCAAGAGTCVIADVQHPVEEGFWVLIPAHVAHSYYADGQNPWSIWWLHLLGSDIPDLIGTTGVTLAAPTARLSDRHAVFELIESVYHHLDQDDTRTSLAAASGSAWYLLTLLGTQPGARPIVDQQPIRAVRDHLRAHVDQRFSISDLAERAGFSSSHFSARFRTVTGYSVTEYVKRLRMARARRLLITTGDPVAAIAETVGYSDPFYFTRQFTTVNGISPTAFRANHPGSDSARPDKPS